MCSAELSPAIEQQAIGAVGTHTVLSSPLAAILCSHELFGMEIIVIVGRQVFAPTRALRGLSPKVAHFSARPTFLFWSNIADPEVRFLIRRT